MSTTLVPLIGPVPGGMELVVILLIAVLLFGANKIPKLARSTGQAMGEFQRGREEVEQELEEMKEGPTSSSSGELGDTTETRTDAGDTLGDTEETSSETETEVETETETEKSDES